jgi:hypothetical protein
MIDGAHGGDVRFDSFDWELPFTIKSIGVSTTSAFTVDFNGLITADARFCADFPQDDLPSDCTSPIDPVWAEGGFVAERRTTIVSLILPFSMSVTANGWMHFSNTDGGRVRITIAGGALADSASVSGMPSALPVPEPASWTAMLFGMGLIGCIARWRRRLGVRPA